MGTKRIYSLDFVKLVAIYLVLWGHCIQSLIPVSYTHLTLPTKLEV